MTELNLSACYTIFKLVAGTAITGEPEDLPEPYRAGALTVIGANGNGRPAAFNEWLAILDNSLAEEVSHALRLWHMHGQPDEPPPPHSDTLLPDMLDMPELPKEARLTPRMEREAHKVGNWLNEYVTFANQACPMSPPEFHEALGMVIMSTAIARRVGLAVSTKMIFPNLFLLIVAVSTRYRKTTAFGLATDVMDKAGMRCLRMGSRQTPESLMLEMSKRRPPHFDDWDGEAKDLWRAERQFAAQRAWLMDEASSLFDSFKRDYSSGLLPMLLHWHDCPGYDPGDNTITRGRHVLRDVYLSVAGPTTPAMMAVHFGERAHWENGLWARFNVVTPVSPPRWNFWPEPMDIPAALADPLKKLTFERLPLPPTLEEIEMGAKNKPIQPLIVALEDGVWAGWEAYSKAVSHDLALGGEVDTQILANYGRLSEISIKLAMQLATFDWIDSHEPVPTIRLGH